MEQEVKKVDVIICTPGHSVMGGYLRSLLMTVEELNNRQISWAFANDYSSHVGNAREITLNGSNQNSILERRPFKGEVEYKKLFWIDSDITWQPQDFMKLYESEKDIISGAYLLASGEVTAYKEKLGRSFTYEEVKEMKEPQQVHGVGFGFLAVKQGVFESLSRPWFQSAIVTMKDTETGEEFTFPLMGEDISWCERVNQAGFEVWFDPTVQVTHNKMVKLTWEGIQP